MTASVHANSPVHDGLSMPAEWAPHRACWMAWPSHEGLWGSDLAGLRREFTELCRAISGERIEILVLDEAGRTQAAGALEGLDVGFHRLSFGDIWVRDTAPIFLSGRPGRTSTVRFSFNGWGGKYLLDGDRDLAERMAGLIGGAHYVVDMVFEGGAIDVDGNGLAIVPRSCLLARERNPGLDEKAAARSLSGAFGVSELLWLDGMLAGDHTDGHVDTLARFVPGGRVLVSSAAEKGDANEVVLQAVSRRIRRWCRELDQPLDVVEVPVPGKVVDEEGQSLPASYLNFYVSNGAVVVPVFGSPYDNAAVDAIASCFSDRDTVGLDATHLLRGGGAFHCITMQEPATA